MVSRKPYAESLTTPVPVIQLNPAALSSVPPSIAAPPPAPAGGVNPHGGVNASMLPGPGKPAPAASAGSAGQ